MLKVGLTGGLGSGKTTVSNLFARRAIPVIDADEIARALVGPGSPALAAVVACFGPHVLEKDGTLNRGRLREIVFHSSADRKKLESIMHPRVFAAMRQALCRLDAPYCILCIPLLLETHHEKFVDRILVVDCPPEIQIARVKSRDRLPDAIIRNILKAQVSRGKRLKAADDIIRNDSDQKQLDIEVEKLHNLYLSYASRR